VKKKRKEIKKLAIPRQPNPQTRFFGVFFAAFILIAAGILAYGNSLHGPFIYDDIPNIVDNQAIRDILNIMIPSQEPTSAGIYTRPVIQFSLAVNYAIGGDHVMGYHILNLAVHLLAGIILFGIVRRTLHTERMKPIYGQAATLIGFACALIWLLHPLQTQAVTYIIQRCESMMGMFFLLTFYCAIRGWQSSHSGPWHGASVLFFLLGVGSKEVIAVAPPLLLLYDVIFIHGRLGDAIRKSWTMYVGLMCGIALLGLLVMRVLQVAKAAGVKESLPLVQYWQTQPEVILHYLRLVVWPDAFCLDYAWPLTTWQKAWPSILVVLALIARSGWAVFKCKPFGFLGAWFFAILATTSLVPLPDPAFEHRMYLPLAAIVVLGVVGVYRLGLILQARYAIGKEKMTIAGVVGLVVLAMLLGGITYKRNGVYADEVSIWTDTVKKSPRNGRAHLNLGVELDRLGRIFDAIAQFEEAIRLKVEDGSAHANLGYALYRMGKTQEAIGYYQAALTMNPRNVAAYSNLGYALYRMGKTQEAIGYYQVALTMNPLYVAAHSNLGIALWESGQRDAARKSFETALKLKPDQPEVLSNLGNMLNSEGRYKEAMVHLRGAIRLRPAFAEAHANLGFALEKTGNPDDAMREYAEALRLNPSLKEVQNSMEGLARRLAVARKNK
jgi:tetratricopeptide (TPR) repeat protein